MSYLSDREALCPECGSHLAVSVEKVKKTGKIKLVFWCDGDHDDKFRFELLTGLTNDDLDALLLKEGTKVQLTMVVKLLERETKPIWEE